MQFHILLTTYEMVMRDSMRLNKLEWRYIVIDEAQRMKDSKSKLSRDLMKFKVIGEVGGNGEIGGIQGIGEGREDAGPLLLGGKPRPPAQPAARPLPPQPTAPPSTPRPPPCAQAQRRLLLTGTPLQNDLRELWALLNLLLPEVRGSPIGGGGAGRGRRGERGQRGRGREWGRCQRCGGAHRER